MALVGPGNIAELATVNPEDFRRGPQTLPLIDVARRVQHDGIEMHIAGSVIHGRAGSVYIDRERPREGHIEMVGPEIHLGIPLTNVDGVLKWNQIGRYQVPQHELRTGEVNPLRKALGFIRFSFEIEQAQNLAATLIYYGQNN